jgi:transcriptional regulator with XRE-family HTH domain
LEINKVEVGQRIREIRKMHNLSMEKFGQLIDGLPRSTVNNWERGINLPKPESMNRIAEIGHVTNEYLLYGDQENQYILNMLRKKAEKLDPSIEEFILNEIKQNNRENEQSLNRLIDFFVANLMPPTEADRFSFKQTSQEKNMYLGFTNFGKEAQLYLHHDTNNNILHIMPATFADFSRDRLLVYLGNEESLPYFAKNLEEKLLEKTIIIYTVDKEKNETRLAPLIFSKKAKSYQFEKENLAMLTEQFLYYPFIRELEKIRLFNQEYDKKNEE